MSKASVDAAMTRHLSILLCIPAAAALAIGLIGYRRQRLVRVVGISAALSTMILAALLWAGYQPRGAEWQFVERLDWRPALGASYHLGIDGFSLALIVLTALLGLAVSLGAGGLSAGRARFHHASILALEFGLFGVFMSLDLLLWCGFVVLTLVCAASVVRAGAAGSRSPAWTWLATFAASALVLAGVLALWFSHYTQSGVSSFDLPHLRQAVIPPAGQTRAFVLLCLGFAVAAGLVPRGRGLPGVKPPRSSLSR